MQHRNTSIHDHHIASVELGRAHQTIKRLEGVNKDLRRDWESADHLLRGFRAVTSDGQKVEAQRFADSFAASAGRPRDSV